MMAYGEDSEDSLDADAVAINYRACNRKLCLNFCVYCHIFQQCVACLI